LVMGISAGSVTVSRSALGEGLDRGLVVRLSASVAVAFNPSYVRSAGAAYSTPLRPDVVLTLNGARFAFDAKYRLQWLTSLEDGQDDEA
ncbi:nuclease domain-containing protein, partial [Pseudomonas aeruginosa]